MALTIHDISKEAGVSIATVSRVLNGSDKVKPATKEKILEIVKKHNYAPNASARAMKFQYSKTIGILCPDASDLFYSKAVHMVEHELQKNGYEALICSAGYKKDIQKNFIDLIISKKVDALILVGSDFIGTTEDEKQYIKEASEHMPIILMNSAFDYPNVYSVLCDDFASTFEATSDMIKSGVRDILYLYNSHSYSGTRKLDGYKAAMEKYCIKDYEKYIHCYQQNSERFTEVVDFVDAIVKSGQEFHGIVCSNDSIAIGCLKYAQLKGIRVPEQLSVIGYNNSFLTDCCIPDLSSVNNRINDQAHAIVQILLGVLAGKEMPKKTVFPGELIKRGSTRF